MLKARVPPDSARMHLEAAHTFLHAQTMYTYRRHCILKRIQDAMEDREHRKDKSKLRFCAVVGFHGAALVNRSVYKSFTNIVYVAYDSSQVSFPESANSCANVNNPFLPEVYEKVPGICFLRCPRGLDKTLCLFSFDGENQWLRCDGTPQSHSDAKRMDYLHPCLAKYEDIRRAPTNSSVFLDPPHEVEILEDSSSHDWGSGFTREELKSMSAEHEAKEDFAWAAHYFSMFVAKGIAQAVVVEDTDYEKELGLLSRAGQWDEVERIAKLRLKYGFCEQAAKNALHEADTKLRE